MTSGCPGTAPVPTQPPSMRGHPQIPPCDLSCWKWQCLGLTSITSRTIHRHKMIRKTMFSLGRHVSSMARGTTQVRRLLHGGYVRIHPSVQEALVEGRPVVALESTIITHGMAYPLNLSMAREVEEIVRTNGAVPATVALDVSADLTELGRTPVAVVAAGAKSILDIGRTLEYLETQGVCVAAFGESREFPAFFSRQSGFQAPYHVRDEEEAAKLIDSALGLGLGSGVLIAVPCPQERAAQGQAIEEAIQQALSQARSKGITGKEVTPFLLQKLVELTDGKSLDSSILLLNGGKKKVVIGGINVDFIAKAQNPDILGGGQTNAGRVRRTFGGVGRNLADCLSRLGRAPLLLSAVGKDEHLESVLHYCHHMDMSSILQLEGKSTATYCAVITSAGELSVGLGDMDIHHQITEQYVSQFKESLCQAPLVCMDGNVPLSTIQYVCQLAREHQLAVCYEPTDENKASKPFLSDSWKALTYISPNLQELRAINRTLGNPLPAELPSRLEDVVQAAVALACPLLAHLHCVVVTLGAHGVLLCGKSLGGSISLYPGTHEQTAAARLCAAHYPAIPIGREEIGNVSGAGDSLMAGMLAGMLAKHDTGTCVRMGLLAASLSLRSYEPISPEISTSSVSQEQVQSRSWPEVKRPLSLAEEQIPGV
ncbi:hypothetical protein IHE44_0011906 [Lamprotornis superbus]|uniref:Carbohydrate kinase PfkB domain-containing protein n=1 Tax=Lamprotornis superbus TaxID=245042 RepID=A0A835NWL1_9PASS|nr:hypothetical protein IHE44_0011906 [Lamprotornis superbus]